MVTELCTILSHSSLNGLQNVENVHLLLFGSVHIIYQSLKQGFTNSLSLLIRNYVYSNFQDSKQSKQRACLRHTLHQLHVNIFYSIL